MKTRPVDGKVSGRLGPAAAALFIPCSIHIGRSSSSSSNSSDSSRSSRRGDLFFIIKYGIMSFSISKKNKSFPLRGIRSLNR